MRDTMWRDGGEDEVAAQDPTWWDGTGDEVATQDPMWLDRTGDEVTVPQPRCCPDFDEQTSASFALILACAAAGTILLCTVGAPWLAEWLWSVR